MAVLTSRGSWQEAEKEITSALDDMRAHHPGIAVDGVTRLADLRRRQGRLDDAEELFAAAEFHPRGLLGLAAVALDRGDHVAAIDRSARYLRRIPDDNRAERAAGLEVLVRAAAAVGDTQRGRGRRQRRFRSLADAVHTPLLQAAADEAAGVVLAADRQHEQARRRLEDAVDWYGRSEAPFEAMRARMTLARSLAALGRTDEAATEASAALDTAERIGAELAAEWADALLADLVDGASPPPAHPLTDREVEVLRLVAAGKTNRGIAEELVISEKTVARHLSNIFAKLGLSSRAAATAWAYEHAVV